MAEITHEFEGRIHHTTAKSRLVEIVGVHPDEGKRYFIPKKCTLDFNPSHLEEKLFMFVVNDWWYKKRADFEVTD
jgi:hypothetical protein